MRKIVIILMVLAFWGDLATAADLPSKGKTPPKPPTTRGPGPGDYPGDPGTPIGGGLFILLGMSATYFLVKRKKK